MDSKAHKKPLALSLFITVVLGIWLVLAAFPFLWTLWGSFKVEGDFFSKANWAAALTGELTQVETGGSFTGSGYFGAWVEEEFWRAAWNSTLVCFFVVTISLTLGTLGGYALSRSPYRYAFWFLIIALVFRALPQITLESDYLPVFANSPASQVSNSQKPRSAYCEARLCCLVRSQPRYFVIISGPMKYVGRNVEIAGI